MDVRGGTCIMFDNRLTGEEITARNVELLLREEDCLPRSNLKTTYPTYDRIKDTYIWNNTCNGKPIAVSVEEFSRKYDVVRLGRDYWLESPEPAFYTPYPYPHPLTLLDVQEPEAGTVLLQHFDESKDSTLRDATDNGPDMALPPGAKLVPGRFGRACRLSGEQSLKCLARRMEGGQGMLSMWVNFDRLEGARTLCHIQGSKDGLALTMKGNNGRPELHFQFYDATKKIRVSVKADVGAWKVGAWHQVGVYWDASFRVMRICVDGRMAAKGVLDFTPAFGATMVWIGGDRDLRDTFVGAVDELVIRELGIQ